MSITNDISCQAVITQLMHDYKKLLSNIISCHKFSHKTTKYIGLIISNDFELTDLTTIITEFTNLETNIDQCIEDIGAIDINIIDLSLFPIETNQSLDTTVAGNYFELNYGIISTEFIKSFEEQVKNIIINNLTFWESEATQFMFKLNNCVVRHTHATVIEKIDWVDENLCVTNQILPTVLEINGWLNKYGLDEDMFVDYSQQIFTCLNMPLEVQTFFTTLLTWQETIHTKLKTLNITYQGR